MATIADVTIEDVKSLLRDTLQLGDRADRFAPDTRLLGDLPELDSMGVATLITAIEDRFDVMLEDEEISGEIFETVGALHEFVQQKLAS